MVNYTLFVSVFFVLNAISIFCQQKANKVGETDQKIGQQWYSGDYMYNKAVLGERHPQPPEQQPCSLTIQVPMASLQAHCPNTAHNTEDLCDKKVAESLQQCQTLIQEAERKFQHSLLHEASVRLELEQRFLHLENLTRHIAKFYKETDFPNKELLQHMLNRLHLEKLAREDLEAEVARLQQKLQVSESIIDCEYVRRPGVYTIRPLTSERSVQVYCDRGWTVLQRRINGVVDFYRGWQSYRDGFGDLEGEFWLGNDNIHAITKQTNYRLQIEMTDWEGEAFFVEYDQFWIEGVSDNYRLHVAGHHGNLKDGLNRKGSRHNHNKMPFSTFDQNNQPNKTSYCAEIYHGAWWYNSCYASNLNGRYCNPEKVDSQLLAQCMVWWSGNEDHMIVMKTVTMRVRETQDSILYLREVEED